MGKIIVTVYAVFHAKGDVEPKEIDIDGNILQIEASMNIGRRANQKAGIMGICYACQVKGRILHLYRDEDDWLLETKDPPKEWIDPF